MDIFRPQNLPSSGAIESWDDDEDLQGFESLQLRQTSTNTAFTHTSTRSTRHRESVSSRVSNKSGEDDNEWDLSLENPAHAIQHAHNAGVPIPTNIPASALVGGTIKKLGTKKKASKDNYEDDIDFSFNPGQGLKLSTGKHVEYPAILRNTSATISPGMAMTGSPETPTKSKAKLSFQEHLDAMGQGSGNSALDRFRDNEEDDDVFADVPTIKIGKTRSPLKNAGFYALPQSIAKPQEVDDMMDGLEFGESNSPLRLTKRKVSPATSAHLMPADLDVEGFDHSSGSFHPSVRGSRPSGRSDRSSSVTAHSPSVFSPALSSSFTAESEDDDLEGLVLPDGPVNLGEALKRRLEHVDTDDRSPAKRPEMQAPPKDDFFDDLDVEDGKVFENGKLTLNRNVKYSAAKSTSPSRRGGTTLTFTNKPSSGTTRIPKPSPIERPRSKMETIAENAPTPQPRRAGSRMLTHSAHGSVTSLPTPTTPTIIPPSVPATPTRRGLGTRSSTQNIRQEPTTTSAQLLKAKRSMPHLRSQGQPRPQSMYARPPSRTDRIKPTTTRPKTPVERLGSVKTPAPPFLPAGNSSSQSHHVTSRASRNGRPASSDSNDNVGPTNRPLSRLSGTHARPRTPNSKSGVASEELARQAAAKKALTRPTRRRAYGDGTELDGFDDLVTDTKLSRQPREVQSTHFLRSTHRNSGDLRKHFSAHNLSRAAGAQSPAPTKTTVSPPPQGGKVPSFARDTAASRLAREQRTLRSNAQPSRNPHTSEGNLHARFNSQLTVKPAPSPQPRTLRRTKKAGPLQLIQNLGGEVKPQKGMHFNTMTKTWEGNENALTVFDGVPVDRAKTSTPNAASSVSPTRRNNTTPKPALIAPISQNKGVQMVNGMVFDPVHMKWLKMGSKPASRSRHEPGSSIASGSITSGAQRQGARSVTTATEEDDEDVFAGISDIDEGKKVGVGAGGRKKKSGSSGLAIDSDDSSDEDNDEARSAMEHFDVGPEFRRRETKRVEKIMKKLSKWPDSHFEPLSVEQQCEKSRHIMATLWG